VHFIFSFQLTKFEQVLKKELQENLTKSQFVGIVAAMAIPAIDRKRVSIHRNIESVRI